MAAQPGLGLLPDRRSGTGPVDRCHLVGRRPDLNHATGVDNSNRPAKGQRWVPTCAAALFVTIAVLMCSGTASAYSVLTHEEVVDLLWVDEIRPLLLQRYPGLTEDQIKEAHAYAYGGAVIQDLGYYPFGSKEFSDLSHYVRSGDFVRELLLESHDINEYAFALGALAHYASDIMGHPTVNAAVAIEYPKLRARYGKSVTYAQDKTAHLKTEFGFDMVQVAKTALRLAAVSRFHRIQSFEAPARTRLPGNLWFAIQRRDCA